MCRDASEACVRLQQWSTDESYLQGDASSLRSTQNKSVQIGETSNNQGAMITLSVNNGDNDDPPPYTAIPPPYSAITLPNHAGWPYGLFSFGNAHSTDETNCRVQIPLTPFQASLTPTTGFHSERTNDQYALMPLTSERFFKLNYHRSSSESTSYADNIAEKSNDKKRSEYQSLKFVIVLYCVFFNC